MEVPPEVAAGAYADAVLLQIKTGKNIAIQAYDRKIGIRLMPEGLDPDDVSMCVMDDWKRHLPQFAARRQAVPRASREIEHPAIVSELMASAYLGFVIGCIQEEPCGYGWGYTPSEKASS